MIFISHRLKDQKAASLIKDYLAVYNVDSFVSLYAPKRDDQFDVVKWIVNKLNECSHVIALISENTQGSMWVPFELGMAYKANKGIGTFLLNKIEIPEYLEAFPIMNSTDDLDSFIELYFNDRSLSESLHKSIRNASAGGAEKFIENLKVKLGQ